MNQEPTSPLILQCILYTLASVTDVSTLLHLETARRYHRASPRTRRTVITQMKYATGRRAVVRVWQQHFFGSNFQLSRFARGYYNLQSLINNNRIVSYKETMESPYNMDALDGGRNNSACTPDRR
jgi:hypothetical protein